MLKKIVCTLLIMQSFDLLSSGKKHPSNFDSVQFKLQTQKPTNEQMLAMVNDPLGLDLSLQELCVESVDFLRERIKSELDCIRKDLQEAFQQQDYDRPQRLMRQRKEGLQMLAQARLWVGERH